MENDKEYEGLLCLLIIAVLIWVIFFPGSFAEFFGLIGLMD